jgi:hypothetical protein
MCRFYATASFEPLKNKRQWVKCCHDRQFGRKQQIVFPVAAIVIRLALEIAQVLGPVAIFRPATA